jgi:hypothetical protein
MVKGGFKPGCILLAIGLAVVFVAGTWAQELFIRGDIDGNSVVDIGDLTALQDGGPFLCDDAADVNDDGMVNVADEVYLTRYVVQAVSPPFPPFPTCGTDPTPDALGCTKSWCICPVVMTGDVNEDGVITASDIIYLVGYVFKGGLAPQPLPESGDVNCDEVINSSDIVYEVNHVFKGGAAPCDVCATLGAPSDPVDPDSLEDQLSSLAAGICDSASTNVVWLSLVPPTWEYDTTTIGDTVSESERCYAADSQASYMRIPIPSHSVRGGSASYVSRTAFADNRALSPAGNLYFFGVQYSERGSPWSSQTLRISGNLVTVAGYDFLLRDPEPLDPTLEEQIREARENPPTPLTPAQIAAACAEGSLNIVNCRVRAVLESNTRYYTNTDGESCYFTKTASVLYEHGWHWDCPDGPAVRKEVARFECSWVTVCDGQVEQSGDWVATFSRNLEVR